MPVMVSVLTMLLLTVHAQTQALAQQVYRCLNPAQTEREYADKPCAPGASAALIDVTPNSAATAAAIAADRPPAASAAPALPNPPVNEPFKSEDDPAVDTSGGWARSNPKAPATTTFDQDSLRTPSPHRTSK